MKLHKQNLEYVSHETLYDEIAKITKLDYNEIKRLFNDNALYNLMMDGAEYTIQYLETVITNIKEALSDSNDEDKDLKKIADALEKILETNDKYTLIAFTD